jgi:hypothetical protein
MQSLSQTRYSAAKEFADTGIADTEDGRDFAITEALGAQVEADLLLFGEPGDRAVKARAPFAIEEKLLGVFMRIGEVGVEGDGGTFEPANVEALIVRHAKDPSTQIIDALAPAKNDIEAQKDFLSGFLSLRRRQAQEQQVTIDILTSFFEEA